MIKGGYRDVFGAGIDHRDRPAKTVVYLILGGSGGGNNGDRRTTVGNSQRTSEGFVNRNTDTVCFAYRGCRCCRNVVRSTILSYSF
jgi:hypothetical protein